MSEMEAVYKAGDLERLELALSGGYYFGQLERRIGQIEPLTTLGEPREVHIDLGGVAFIGPTALALLLATVMRLWEELRCPVMIYPPRNPLTHNYLLRMDFVRHFLHATDVPEPFTRRNPMGFRPCEHFITSDECVAAARQLTAAIEERTAIEKSSRNALQVCLHELSENVIFHADSPLGGFTAVTASKARHEIEIGIVDLGIGIRASLAKNPDYADISTDQEAVRKAMIPTVSSTPERNSGYGLAWTQLMLLLNGGSMRLRSGYGAATFGLEAGGIKFDTKDTALPGTLVSIRARLDNPLDATKIWAALDKAITKANAARTRASHPSSS
jgi:anti-sigma regulatory factor (Ser/Thr protein kinase)